MRKYRRKIKKRKNTSEKTKMKFTAVLVIIIISVNNSNESSKDQSYKANKEESVADFKNGFALQFGVFSTKEAATELVNSLASKGIEAKIVESNNQFKVISPIIQTKDEALGKLQEIKDKNVEDVFIASF